MNKLTMEGDNFSIVRRDVQKYVLYWKGVRVNPFFGSFVAAFNYVLDEFEDDDFLVGEF